MNVSTPATREQPTSPTPPSTAAETAAPAGGRMKVHPLAEQFPMLPEDELAELAADIKENGLVYPIIVDDEGVLIDGRNRLAACKIAEVEPRFEKLGERNPIALILSTNVKRRNLSRGQQVMAVAMAYPEPEKGGRGKKSAATNCSPGERFFRSHLSEARAVLSYSPKLAKAVFAGTTSLKEALAEVKAAEARLVSDDVKLERLRAEAPDLADSVKRGPMTLSEATAALEQRIRDEREAKHSWTRRLNVVLAALEPGEGTPKDVAQEWIRNIDFGLEPYGLPLTRHRLDGSLAVFAAIINHLKGEAACESHYAG